MDTDAYKLKEYIEEISLVQEQDYSDLTAMKSCYEKYNFTEEQEKKLKNISHSHKKRSEDLLLQKKLNGSIISMERAVEINPISEEFRNTLAQLYLMRAKKEGFKKKDRDLAFQNASLSIKINSENPIAKSIIKEIKKNDDKLSGKDLNKKLIPLILVIIVFAIAALFMEKKYLLPIFTEEEKKETTPWIKPPLIEKKSFSIREMDTQINNYNKDFEIDIKKSIIEKTNGSYSYTLLGEINSPEKTVETADLDINFMSDDGKSLFKKVIPLVKENQLILPGEVIVVDQFFYIHYLPPDIDKITLNIKNSNFSDKNAPLEESRLLDLEWETARPEGVRIEFFMKNEETIKNYSQTYKNMKILLKNKGFTEINRLEINLSWRDNYGAIVYKTSEKLIGTENLPLTKEKNRIFYLFSEIPDSIISDDNNFFIEIDRIN